MKKLTLILASLVCIVLGSASVHAAVTYWDSNGTVAGAGDTPNGNWDGDAFWNVAANGTGATNLWSNGDAAVFSAGSDATNAYTVNIINGQVVASSLTFKNGAPTIAGIGIAMNSADQFPITNSVDVTNSAPLGDFGGSPTFCGIAKYGSGRLVLSGASAFGAAGYTNTVAEGILEIAIQSGLGGSALPTVVLNGASLATIGNAMTEPLILNGMGVTNGGALYGTTGLGGNLNGWQGGAVLDSNSRINYYGTVGNWWALQGTAIRNVGANAYDLYLGGSGNTIRLNADAILQLGEGALYKDGTVQLRTEAPVYAREFHWNGGSIFNRVTGGAWFLRMGAPSDPVHPAATNYVGAGAGLWSTDKNPTTIANSWVFLSGANPVISGVAAGAFNFNGVLSGEGGWKKNNDTCTVFLNAVNTYSGATIVRGGTLKLGAAGSISNTTPIDIQAGAIFDVTANASGFTLQSVQTLMGGGTVSGNVKADGLLSPGASIGTLTFNNDLTIAGNLSIEVDRSVPTSDLISVLGVLTNAGTGTLTVVNTNAALQVGDTFTIFDKPLLNGLALTVTGGGATWTNRLDQSPSTIAVLAIAPKVAATNLTIAASGANSFTLGGNGGAGLSYNIYAYTNVGAPLATWWLIGTANANGSGVISYVDTQATNNQRYYRFGQ